jgi:hypothetical protein
MEVLLAICGGVLFVIALILIAAVVACCVDYRQNKDQEKLIIGLFFGGLPAAVLLFVSLVLMFHWY